jgi:site-specific recombinase XerD
MKKTTPNPATVYLNSLSPSGRRSMRCLLKSSLILLNKSQPIEKFRWQTLTYADLIKVKMKLQEQGKAVNTINLTISAMRGVMQSAFHLGLIKADQLLHVQSVKRLTYRPKINGRSLNERECKKLIKQCARDKSVKGVRDGALLSVMLTTGLRRVEIKSINMIDYDRKQHELKVYCTKTHSERVCPITRSVAIRLHQWLQVRGRADGALFCPVLKNQHVVSRLLSTQAIYTIVQQRSKMAGLGKVTPHDLRRTYVTHLLDANVDINIVRQLVGHRDIKTTARYDYRMHDSHKYTKRIFATI